MIPPQTHAYRKDIRFLAPVGIMVFFAFLFSPASFLFLVMSLSKTSWIIGVIGVLGIGFMISSVTEFLVRNTESHLGWHNYNYQKIFKLKESEKIADKASAQELATWIILDRENDLYKNSQSGIPNQIHKRWNMAMANYNSVLGPFFGLFIALSLSYLDWIQVPELAWILLYFLMLSLFILIFWKNGERARRSVLCMDDLLASKNE